MNRYMELAIKEAREGIEQGDGGPFGCVIVKNGKVVGKGHNMVLACNDPTAHGEIEAIRDACNGLGTYDLSGCELYTTHFPCPMCNGAIRWANIKKVYAGCTIEDTEKIGFRDKLFYETNLEVETLDRDECLKLSEDFDKNYRVNY